MELATPSDVQHLASLNRRYDGAPAYLAFKIETAMRYWALFDRENPSFMLPLLQAEVVLLQQEFPNLATEPVANWWLTFDISDYYHPTVTFTNVSIHHFVTVQGTQVCAKCGASMCGSHPWDWVRMPCRREGRTIVVAGNEPEGSVANDWAYLWVDQAWSRNPNLAANTQLGACCSTC